ncbi:MAG: efflux RND transporter periplasmic adaptor subunit [Prevotella sp.]|nr:efflux RND transporter periplasmic adaptor subunit [Prevotella sp.]
MNTKQIIITMASAALLISGCSKEKPQSDNIVTVRTATASATAHTGEQSYAGTIEEMSGTSLSFAGAGTIRRLDVREGQNIAAGQLIGIIDAQTTGNAAAMARATTNQAREALNQANDAHARMKLLHDNGSLPEIKWVEVETKVAQAKQMLASAQAAEQIARKGLADTRLTAPFSGYIARKNADIGQNVLPGQEVVKLVKIDQVKVRISVPEDEIAGLRIGQKVTFRVSSLAGATFFGQISEKSVSADPISRSYTVWATVANSGHRLLPGMICDVHTSVGRQDRHFVLPANLVQIDVDNKPFVWIVEQGTARRRSIVLGDNIGENVIVSSGLTEGDEVIVAGQQKVSDGQKVAAGK